MNIFFANKKQTSKRTGQLPNGKIRRDYDGNEELLESRRFTKQTPRSASLWVVMAIRVSPLRSFLDW
jgi:hypothetical protein